MNDLISRSDVLELLYKIFDKYRMSTDKNTSIGKSFGTDVFEEIRNMPTAYSLDKVVEELEEIINPKEMYFCRVSKGRCIHNEDDIECIDCVAQRAIEIVKQGGVSDDV